MYKISHDEKYEIYYKTWNVKNDITRTLLIILKKEIAELKGKIYIVHGLGEHCHRYERIIQFFNENGFRVHAFDHRGHGLTHNHMSSGKQGHCGHIDSEVEVIMRDIDELVEAADENEFDSECDTECEAESECEHKSLVYSSIKVPKYLLGHSLGGLMTIYYALTRDLALTGLTGLTGLITLAPAIGVSRPPNMVIRSMAPFVAKIIPTFTIESDIRSGEISRLPEVEKALRDDQMIHRKISFGTGKAVLDMLAKLDELDTIKIPTLFIHGTADKITDPIATEEFYKKLKCPLKRLYLHPDGYHKVHDDLGYELVFDEIYKFIKETS